MDAIALKKEIEGLTAAHDRAGSVEAAMRALDSGLPVIRLYDEVLAPILREAGEAWQKGVEPVWEEHLASMAIRDIIEAAYPKVLEGRPASIGKSVLLACPEDEHHEIGLRMLADRFELTGWTAHFLGAHTPTKDIIDAAARLEVDLIVINASTHNTRLHLRPIYDEIKDALPDRELRVGGAAFALSHDGWREEELLDVERYFGR